ncbi:MAG: hypothetical protein WBW48_16775 [Anaerolineae bacterium]
MPGGYRIFSGTNYAYFITCTIVEWLPVFVSHLYFNLIVESLKHLHSNC